MGGERSHRLYVHETSNGAAHKICFPPPGMQRSVLLCLFLFICIYPFFFLSQCLPSELRCDRGYEGTAWAFPPGKGGELSVVGRRAIIRQVTRGQTPGRTSALEGAIDPRGPSLAANPPGET